MMWLDKILVAVCYVGFFFILNAVISQNKRNFGLNLLIGIPIIAIAFFISELSKDYRSEYKYQIQLEEPQKNKDQTDSKETGE